MNTLTTSIKIIAASLLISGTAYASSAEPLFKVATMKSSMKITGTQKLTSFTNQKILTDTFASAMKMCAENLKNKDIAETQACSQAIETGKYFSHNSKKSRYLKSLSYSNRGVARYLNNDKEGALSDFEQAAQIDKNSITTANLRKIQTRLNTVSTDSNNTITAD